ncbi:hypothetical protein [Mycobacterium sp. 1081908.1]|uniref:hypothetical protein n=1 Tax=Mycobacterium sp. 1081908.1 TaxID=1834066 RepID=UPI0012EABC09|nr:hypothetical protein [Mycobacterium sp. 1081908.1]
MAKSSRRRGRLGLGVLIILSLLSLALIGYGGINLWAQHSGLAARMTVLECQHHRSTRSVRQPMPFPWKPDRDSCFGAIANTPRTYETSMHISGAKFSDIGHDIDVHIRGREAVADAWLIPPIYLGVGCALAVVVLIAAVRRRRRSPGDPWDYEPPAPLTP